MTATLSPTPTLYYPNTNNTGAPAAGFKLFTYIANTNIKQNTWTDSTQSTVNDNPLPLDANGFAAKTTSSAVFLDPTLVYKYVWAPANDTDPPSSPIRTIDNISGPLDLATLTQALIGLVLYPRTAAEIAAAVTPVNYAYAPGHVYRYGTNTSPGVTDMTAALNASLLQSYQAGGSDPFWPGNSLLVSSLTVTGSCHIRTDGYATILKQKSGLASDTHILNIQASDVIVDEFAATGNIATDTLEFMHVCVIGGSATYSRITLKGIKGTNIRGDVLYLGGSAANPVYNVIAGDINGTNIYRNVVSFVGVGGCEVASITGTQIGYRLFDVEPNAGVSQAPTGIHIGYVRSANMLFAGDPTINIGSVIIDYADMDNSLLADSVPGYPTHPSAAGNIGVILGNIQSLYIGYLRLRGYQERGVNDSASTIRGNLVINYLDVDTTNTTEAVFKAIIFAGTSRSVTINGGTAVMQGLDRYLIKCDNICIPTVRNMAVSGGPICANAQNGVFENIAVNGSALASTLFADVHFSQLRGLTCTNVAADTLMATSSNNRLYNITGTFSATGLATSNAHIVDQSVINSTTYFMGCLEAAVAFNPPNIAGATTSTTTVTVTGAAAGDFATASFGDIVTANAALIDVTAKVTAANTVTVYFRNSSAATAVDLANDSLRVRVWKPFT